MPFVGGDMEILFFGLFGGKISPPTHNLDISVLDFGYSNRYCQHLYSGKRPDLFLKTLIYYKAFIRAENITFQKGRYYLKQQSWINPDFVGLMSVFLKL